MHSFEGFEKISWSSVVVLRMAAISVSDKEQRVGESGQRRKKASTACFT